MQKTLFTTFFISSILFSFSQGYETTKYGVRAGVNISNLNFEPTPIDRNLHRNGFYFGGFAEFSLSETLWLNTEIQWSAEGAKDEDWKANYINIPVQLKFVTGDRFSIGLGPQLGIKTWKSSDAFDTMTYGGVAGIEYQFLKDYFIDVRATYKLNNMLDEDNVPPGLEASQFSIQVGIGIKI